MQAPFLPFAMPDIGEEELAQMRECIETGWITTGPKTKQLEQAFAEFVGCRHAIAVNSCTAALHLALEATGIEAGDQIIVPTYTFASSAEVIRYFNATPVFVDIEPENFHLSPEQVKAAVNKKTRAIMPIHIAGLPVNIDAIESIAKEHDLTVIEDAAHALPCHYKGKTIGSISDFTCFSFYATKTLTTGEGGMICTNDDEKAERCRIMSLHGISKDAWKRYSAEGSWFYQIIAPGYKYNMSDIAAGMGLAQLAKCRTMWQRRRQIAEQYQKAFASLPQWQIPLEGEANNHAWHLYMLRLNLDTLTANRGQCIEELKKQNIGTSVHFIPLHMHPYYQKIYRYSDRQFPVAYNEYLREISLPIYSKMTDGDVKRVIDAIIDFTEKYAK